MLNLLILVTILGFIIFLCDRLFKEKGSTTDKINENLPQANCGRCGYAGCKHFAEALSKGEANISDCHLLNAEQIKNIEKITGLKYKKSTKTIKVAFIDESKCIGCTKCIRNCPTDCIIGSAKKAHTVISKNCSGCEICVQNCPVQAIKMVEYKNAENSKD